MNSSKNFVIDACVLIDIEKAALTELFFSLPIYICTSNILAHQEKGFQEAINHFATLGLHIQDLDPELMRRVISISPKHSALSLSDVSLLILAEDMMATLLTNERALRRIAADRGIEVHGTLKVLEMLIEAKSLSVEEAVAKFQKLLALGSRLPEAEFTKMISEIKKGKRNAKKTDN